MRFKIKPRNIYLTAVIGLSSVLVLSFQNCSQVQFENAENLSEVDRLSLPGGTLLLNNGNPYTNKRSTQAEILGASEVDQMQFFNSSDCRLDDQKGQLNSEESGWQKFEASSLVELAEQSGLKTVSLLLKKGDLISDCIQANVTLDEIIPSVKVVEAPVDYSRSEQAQFQFEVSKPISGIEGVYCRLDEGDFRACNLQEMFDVSEGNHTLQVYTISGALNRSETLELNWLVDLTPPVINITSPNLGQIIPTNSAVVEFEASDINGSGLSRVACSINGSPMADCQSPLVLSDLTNGVHQVVIMAQDRADWVTEKEVKFEIRNIIPGAFSILGLGVNETSLSSFLKTDLDKLFWSQSKDAQSYQYRILQAGSNNEVCSGTLNSLSLDLSACPLTQAQSYSALVIARNNANTVSSAPYQFKVDKIAPKIDILNTQVTHETGKAKIDFMVSGTGSNLTSVTCKRTFQDSSVALDCLVKNSIEFNQLLVGRHLLEISAVDEAGHSSKLEHAFEVKQVVCDPFGNNTAICAKGLKATLHYANNEDRARGHDFLRSKFHSVNRVIQEGIESSSIIYLPNLDVRTVTFEKGFVQQNGNAIRDNSGSVLNEWFGLNIYTVVKLAPNQQAGRYQLIVVSDDGSTVDLLDVNGNRVRNLINNDGLTSTRVGCAASGDLLTLDANTRIPLNIKWHQGPKHRLGMSVFWKRIDPGQSESRSYCNASGSTWGFAEDESGSGYKRLFDAGFVPLKTDNFLSGD